MSKLLTYRLFSRDNIKVFSTTRAIGSTKTDGKLKWKNLEKAMKLNNLEPANLVFPEQVHGNKIEFIKNATRKIIPKKDGLVTKNKNIFLGVVTADCAPIVFYSSKNKMIGVFHAGYKGILSGILNEAVKIFKADGESLQEVKVLVGPSIGLCCYEVGKKIIDEFSKNFLNIEKFYSKKEDKYFLDLKFIIKEILLAAGISGKNMEFSAICTKDNSSFLYSARKSKNKRYGEFATIVGMI
ncbi:MAG: peptidoglycan editing factor PgeF [Candidatus Levybacteria bacterium CG_4_9_14_3_um_filter_35_16]|nr:MAG: hypothetical protein COW87_00730 [Candidatus Levybacteria bacterium CG22_combo_CG10-13_8_21_14_all_35_11]PIY94856.1 MAG: peptidoglycan editing factor PgeF [Candidatus Levybacteria bacterium CG_4_10_14_0_8_um_filter_35_23]PIZ98068.1 MAG: peptidoglycan editing factor PgeF [Candidatus Levybacteria bacterium CG_4_10_14_0_2_um_filter_35_8]PJA91273.1 MAG: peptidoglycan editing factor PgeF [Candidatus Levybacteria bacterium CG_4_9_14_3_um_filter_35_16]PJC54284.1 MAG: peptidoglycan editing fact